MSRYLSLILILIATRESLSYQEEFYLPYSETEDVDFSISRNDGCFQWSTDGVQLVSLKPIFLDYKKQCGHVLEFIVPSNAANPEKETVFKIFAENVDENIGPDTPSIFEYTFHVKPIAKMEIMGLKTTLKVNELPVPFGVSAYDADDNEFDTLDGVQIRWFVGSERDVLEFNNTSNNHDSTTHLVAKASGKASIIVVLEDPNYKSLEPAILEVNVLSALKVEPDGVFLLPGGEVEFKLFEEVASSNGVELKEIEVTGDNPLYSFEVKDNTIATIDKASSLVSSIKEEEDETMLMVKNQDGEVVKNVPIRITNADSMVINAYPTPNQVQILEGEEYEIKVEIFDKNRRPIYPSKNILCKTSYPGQFKVKEVSENGLYAKVHTVSKGKGRVKAHLRSVLTPDDEEIEITPHLRANVDFEIYSPIKMNPSETVLPWDENVKPEYQLNYKVLGGSTLYTYSVDDEEMAESEGGGRFRTRGIRQGSFKARASMANNENIYSEAQVHVIPPESLTIYSHQSEVHVDSFTRIPIYMEASIPEADDPVPFNSCVDLPFELDISNKEYFAFDHTDGRKSARVAGSCASLFISCSKPGATTNITVTYVIPSTQKELSETKSIQCHKSLTIVNPVLPRHDLQAKMYLAIGSTSQVIIDNGPRPWFKEPSTFFRQVEVEDPDIIHVKRVTEEDNYEKNIYDVTCMAEGETSFLLTVGNKESADNPIPSRETREVYIHCRVPRKMNLVLKSKDSTNKLFTEASTGRIVLDNEKSAQIMVVVKDKEGNTLEKVESLKFKVEISDPKLLQAKSESFIIPKSKDSNLPEKPYIDLKSQKIDGDVNVEVTLVDYDRDLLKRRGIEMPASLPNEDDFDEDEEEPPIFSDTIELKLVTKEQLLSMTP